MPSLREGPAEGLTEYKQPGLRHKSIFLGFFSWRAVQTYSETSLPSGPVSNHFHGGKKRLKAPSEAEGRCVVGI